MMQNFIRRSLLLVHQRLPITPLILNRTGSSNAALYDTKLLAIGASKWMAAEAQKKLTALGYRNAKVLGVYNTAESDQELIDALKEKQWDAISIGGHVNGYDQSVQFNDKNIPSDRAEVLLWFNRILNVIHELAPKSKIILVKSGQDIPDGVRRILGGEQK